MVVAVCVCLYVLFHSQSLQFTNTDVLRNGWKKAPWGEMAAAGSKVKAHSPLVSLSVSGRMWVLASWVEVMCLFDPSIRSTFLKLWTFSLFIIRHLAPITECWQWLELVHHYEVTQLSTCCSATLLLSYLPKKNQMNQFWPQCGTVGRCCCLTARRSLVCILVAAISVWKSPCVSFHSPKTIICP